MKTTQFIVQRKTERGEWYDRTPCSTEREAKIMLKMTIESKPPPAGKFRIIKRETETTETVIE